MADNSMFKHKYKSFGQDHGVINHARTNEPDGGRLIEAYD